MQAGVMEKKILMGLWKTQWSENSGIAELVW